MNVDFVALAGACTYSSFFREIFVIDMFPMPPGGHNAENIKKAIEIIVNRFDFDKKKITGIYLILISEKN